MATKLIVFEGNEVKQLQELISTAILANFQCLVEQAMSPSAGTREERLEVVERCQARHETFRAIYEKLNEDEQVEKDV